jgi:hypothetical protein
MYRKFTTEDLNAIHKFLKTLDTPKYLPSSVETNYYTNIIFELLDRLDLDERLALCLFMAHYYVLDMLPNNNGDIQEVD